MKKSALLKQITDNLRANLQVLEEAARAAHTEATDETSRSENKYDTRSLEAGYLAQGQARQLRELIEAIKSYTALELRDFAAEAPIDLTALVRLESGGVHATYFLGPKSGGLEVACEGESVIVITPSSPLGQSLMGKTAGQRWNAKQGGLPITHRIASVQ